MFASWAAGKLAFAASASCVKLVKPPAFIAARVEAWPNVFIALKVAMAASIEATSIGSPFSVAPSSAAMALRTATMRPTFWPTVLKSAAERLAEFAPFTAACVAVRKETSLLKRASVAETDA